MCKLYRIAVGLATMSVMTVGVVVFVALLLLNDEKYSDKSLNDFYEDWNGID